MAVVNPAFSYLIVFILSLSTVVAGSVSQAASPGGYPEFNWDRVPVAFHFGKRGFTMTAEEAKFVASRSSLICLEQGHAGEQFKYT